MKAIILIFTIGIVLTSCSTHSYWKISSLPDHSSSSMSTKYSYCPQSNRQELGLEIFSSQDHCFARIILPTVLSPNITTGERIEITLKDEQSILVCTGIVLKGDSCLALEDEAIYFIIKSLRDHRNVHILLPKQKNSTVIHAKGLDFSQQHAFSMPKFLQERVGLAL